MRQSRPEAIVAEWLGLSAAQAKQVWRGPLEALGAGIMAPPDHWVYRGDFVTFDGDVLRSSAVDRLSRHEARALIDALSESIPDADCRLTDDGGILVIGPPSAEEDISPFEVEGRSLSDCHPPGSAASWTAAFMRTAQHVLAHHPVNEIRLDLKENPANGLWLWGGGPSLQPGSLHQAGLIVSSSRMVRGLAAYAGAGSLELEVAWAPENEGKREPMKIVRLVEGLRQHDSILVYCSLDQSRYASPADKVWALEALDVHVLAPLLTLLEAHRPYRIVLTVDGVTAAARLPVVISGEGIEPDGVGHWDEKACAGGGLGNRTIQKIRSMLERES